MADGWNVGIIENDSYLVSGFTGYKAQKKMNQVLALGVEAQGSGQVIYMVDNPLFRAFWYNTKLLFANAIFLVGQQ